MKFPMPVSEGVAVSLGMSSLDAQNASRANQYCPNNCLSIGNIAKKPIAQDAREYHYAVVERGQLWRARITVSTNDQILRDCVASPYSNQQQPVSRRQRLPCPNAKRYQR